jgi:hypothetical protein
MVIQQMDDPAFRKGHTPNCFLAESEAAMSSVTILFCPVGPPHRIRVAVNSGTIFFQGTSNHGRSSEP